LLLIAPMFGLAQANTRLSNLSSPTSINQHLQPGIYNRYYIGSSIKRWRQGFFYDKISIRPSTNSSHFPNYPLDIVNPNYSRGISVNNTYVGENHRIGVYCYSVPYPGYGYGVKSYGGYVGVYGEGQGSDYDGDVYGVYGYAWGDSYYGYRYGVYGKASYGEYNYGVYGYADEGSSFYAAGYFDGDVWANNFYQISDRKFKTNLQPLKNPLDQLMKLKAYSYQFQTDKYPKIGLSKGTHIGLIADEVKAVYPELVKDAVKPARYNEDKTKVISPEIKYQGVDYTELIPVLVMSVQEQQKTITGLKEENVLLKAAIEEFKTRLTKLEQSVTKTVGTVTLTSAMVEQNEPNPFSDNTIVNYVVPQGVAKAYINIIASDGKVVKNVPLTQRGKGQLVLQAATLAPGVYSYSMYAGGKLVQTKSMVVQR